ncbi:MAG: SDR family oxidoreductase [Candidatus Bathyarchaeota archaeon]|jgi:NAD(P)-dependent dehydrogenase (short-subunit alcohol dehydrogenase family)|nr:SDR family oxidoreductase [Candidatus Bathyarchaeota archaeon]MDP7442741.1 SDR family oxidoreductase [Candidatus Bathyarchaeota archaeon]|tara:strand:+ start:474 stop:1343 length:870 start_codon:yes stop_codon:yes gene_type:complete
MVTGSGRGFGKSLAIAFASEGAKVVSVARSIHELRETERAIKKVSGRVLTVPADISVDSGVRRVHDEVINAFGGLDVLVNNAATNSWLTIEDETMENWDNIMRINLRAPFALTLAFLHSMKERGGGNIINITSRSAESASLAQLAYCPSKYGLEGLTQALAFELKEYNIAVNSLNVASPPGLRLKPTALTIEAAEELPDSVRKLYADDDSMVRFFKDAWVFLALQDGSGITGQRLLTKTLAEVLREEGKEAAIKRYKGKHIQSVYTPIDWPETVRYQTPEGGFKEKKFS